MTQLRTDEDESVGTYVLYNRETGEGYVGSGVLKERSYSHFHSLKNNKHFNKRLQAAYNRNPNFEFNSVPMENREVALEFEQAILDDHYGNPFLLNLARDAQAPMYGRKQSPEHIAKLVASKAGYVTSEETKALLSSGWKERVEQGFKRSPESLAPSIEARRRAVIVEGNRYESQVEAARAYNISPATVLQRINSPYFNTWHRE